MTDEEMAAAVEEVLSGKRRIVSLAPDHIPAWAEADALDMIRAHLSCGHVRVWYSDTDLWREGKSAKIGDMVRCRACHDDR